VVVVVLVMSWGLYSDGGCGQLRFGKIENGT
jgi:hypothetical protein